jgi:hypothetical protein
MALKVCLLGERHGSALTAQTAARCCGSLARSARYLPDLAEEVDGLVDGARTVALNRRAHRTSTGNELTALRPPGRIAGAE